MSLPIPLNSRTFIRNMIPYSYPSGTRAGMDWAAFGGIWDSTDSRNVIYWGPPRPVAGNNDFQLEPGETPQNCVRRLKLAGYIGLYSVRVEQDKRRTDPDPEAPVQRRGGLDKIAEALQQTAAGRINIARASEEGRRPTRAERRDSERIIRRESILSGPSEKIPQMVGVGNGTPEDIDEIADSAEVEAQRLLAELEGNEDPEEELPDVQDEGRGIIGYGLSDRPASDRAIDAGISGEVASDANTDAIAGALPPVISPAPTTAANVSHETQEEDEEDFPEESPDTPVGGGGRAVRAAGAKATGNAAKGKGLAGGGSRRVKAANTPPNK